jgi:hypothetical protein
MLVAKGGTHGGTTLGRVAEWIETNTPAASTLAVLPDGAMLNYLARRTNPTGYLRWNPTECTLFGQDNMTRVFERTQPDYIILIQYEVEGFKITDWRLSNGSTPITRWSIKRVLRKSWFIRKQPLSGQGKILRVMLH